MEFKIIQGVEYATNVSRRELFRLGTVPVAGFLSAVLFFTIRGMMLPRVMP